MQFIRQACGERQGRITIVCREVGAAAGKGFPLLPATSGGIVCPFNQAQETPVKDETSATDTCGFQGAIGDQLEQLRLANARQSGGVGDANREWRRW